MIGPRTVFFGLLFVCSAVLGIADLNSLAYLVGSTGAMLLDPIIWMIAILVALFSPYRKMLVLSLLVGPVLAIAIGIYVQSWSGRFSEGAVIIRILAFLIEVHLISGLITLVKNRNDDPPDSSEVDSDPTDRS